MFESDSSAAVRRAAARAAALVLAACTPTESPTPARSPAEAGPGAMPPTGLCADCGDADFAALIEFMASPNPARDAR